MPTFVFLFLQNISTISDCKKLYFHLIEPRRRTIWKYLSHKVHFSRIIISKSKSRHLPDRFYPLVTRIWSMTFGPLVMVHNLWIFILIAIFPCVRYFAYNFDRFFTTKNWLFHQYAVVILSILSALKKNYRFILCLQHDDFMPRTFFTVVDTIKIGFVGILQL